MKKILFITILIFSMLSLAAQDVSFEADTKSPVKEGERFRIKFTLNAEGENFTPPDFDGFRVLSGPSRSSRSSMQIINGKVTRSVSHEYAYTLQAAEEGQYTIKSATIEVDGKQHKTEPVQIVVQKGSGNAGSGGSSGSSQASPQQKSPEADKEYAFLKAEVDNSNPYLGEQVLVTYKLYYRVSITDYGISQSPSYPGCWSQDIENNGQANQYTETVNGNRYKVAEIHKEAVFPQKTGEIVTKPMEFQILARIRDDSRSSRDPFDRFFDDSFFGGKTVRRNLTSNEIKLDVKPLPDRDKPVSYSGAVGDFSIASEIDKTEVLVNDAINLTLKISGKGNIKLLDGPDIQLSPDFEVYDPEISTNMNTSASGISGNKTLKYLIIPRVAGDYKIGPFEFSYFDAKSETYKSFSTPEYNITVKKGDAKASQGLSVRSGTKRDIQYLGEDIRYIHTGEMNLQPLGTYFFASRNFYLWMLIPLFVFIILTVFYVVSRKNARNIGLQKEKKATRIAKKRLKRSESFLKKQQTDAFYEELSEAIWGYLSYKFDIPLAQLSLDAVRDKLTQKSVSGELIDAFIETLEACEYARFAPGDKNKKMEDLFNQAKKVIIQTEKQLK
ncbi:MAG: BatD family protein [Bacteroidota bacterium]